MQKLILSYLLFLSVQASAQNRPQEPTPQHFWRTLETDASPEAIWKRWTDVPQWYLWDTGLKQADMDGPFVLGARGVISSLEGRKSRFKVVQLEPGQSYTFKTRLPLGALYIKRYLTQENGHTQFTHEVWFSGLTGGIFARQFGPGFMAMLPEVMSKLETLARGGGNAVSLP